MENHRLDELISAKLAGVLDEEGSKELEDLLAKNPDQLLIMQQLEEFWHNKPAIETPDPVVFEAIQEKISEKPVRRLWMRWAIAAAIIGVLGFAGYQLKPSSVSLQQEQVQTVKGERRQFILQDGTKIYLNAESKITCNFTKTSREVWLTGEAYFDVAKEAARPFTVHARTIHVTALGTAFNIKAYSNDHELETTLLEGLVEVSEDQHPEERIRLQPLEKIAYKITSINSNKITATSLGVLPVKHIVPDIKSQDSIVKETAWINNRLEFDMLRFEELASLFERWYNVKIIIQNNKAKDYIFSGSFATETIDQALSALQLTEDFSFEHKDTLVIIH
ncbi:DUF4974 domain-containing protein [Chitinophaga silvatica]|uniref:DUF4974 domain-containing protein n=1 Tax=Chitinophaga silvatica TaxID=2282649 RepID=A0A3E1YGR4_9BACT|nr:FecR domain-containing protein [Chitinophaga silvatica]RFS26557.1 DUF4974 domain-containing protein [Chitinophaga silvatica]